MQFTKNALADYYRNTYQEIAPFFKEEKTRQFTTIALTLIAASFFGIFAINPTLSTIAQLQKQLEDNRSVNVQLDKKIAALNSLQQKYVTLTNDIALVQEAIPQSPEIPLLLAQVQGVAKKSNVTLTNLQTFQIELAKNQKTSQKYSAFVFAADAQGTYLQCLEFLSNFVDTQRITTIDAISLSQDEKTGAYRIHIRGKAYFKT